MKLYVVEGNTYTDEYGDYRHIFGIYNDEACANDRIKEVKATLYAEEIEKVRKNKWHQTTIGSPDDFDIAVIEIEMNAPVNEFIGGYAE